ncbi:MAG: single-stranded DNA-binding protein [Phycisphaerae bacterium]|nr:single-stranded DNA-binding protein [Phycisphaerae bacterium]OUX02110.1 MAG: single-stranded DNA-binding protein [Phycisphaeraceae bacterium TMED231]
MASFNQVILLGNLTRDIELRHTPSNQTVANIGLAVNRTFQTKDGERREETTFVDCESWGRQAEVMAQYLSKGRPVLIQGRLKLDSWQDKDGGNRSKLKVVVENFQFVGGREGGGSGGGDGGGGGSYASTGAPAGGQRSGGGQGSGGGGGHQPVDADDIPF